MILDVRDICSFMRAYLEWVSRRVALPFSCKVSPHSPASIALHWPCEQYLHIPSVSRGINMLALFLKMYLKQKGAIVTSTVPY